MFARLGWYGQNVWRMILESFLFIHDLLEPKLREEFNSLTGMGAYMHSFFNELHCRLTMYVNIRTPTTYVLVIMKALLSGYNIDP